MGEVSEPPISALIRNRADRLIWYSRTVVILSLSFSGSEIFIFGPDGVFSRRSVTTLVPSSQPWPWSIKKSISRDRQRVERVTCTRVCKS